MSSFKKSTKSCVKKNVISRFQISLMNFLKFNGIQYLYSVSNCKTEVGLPTRSSWMEYTAGFTIVALFFDEGFHKLVPWYHKFLKLVGDYMAVGDLLWSSTRGNKHEL